MGGALNNPMSGAVSNVSERRVACRQCGELIIRGARKCRSCKQWVTIDPRTRRLRRSFLLVAGAVLAVVVVLVSTRPSPVGDAPPLTPLPAGEPTGDDVPAPAALGPDFDPREPEPLEPVKNDPKRPWRARNILLDAHPLDVVFSANGATVYVSADDASVREYDLKRGRMVRKATVPAQGDRIRLLHDRYLAVIRTEDAVHIPVLDVTNWDRDPQLLWVGANPADVLPLPDGRTVVTASSSGKRLTWYELPTGRRLGNIRLPNPTSDLYLLRSREGRSFIGALGEAFQGGHASGAWIDLFDPNESPFGATRRSIAVGRQPSAGAVTRDRSSLFLVDRASNEAALLRVDGATKLRTVGVGQDPVGAYLLRGDRWGVTLDAGSKSATIIDMARLQRFTTLMLDGTPGNGATSVDGSTLAVSLGGASWPPMGPEPPSSRVIHRAWSPRSKPGAVPRASPWPATARAPRWPTTSASRSPCSSAEARHEPPSPPAPPAPPPPPRPPPPLPPSAPAPASPPAPPSLGPPPPEPP
jgi:hypothetical protein